MRENLSPLKDSEGNLTLDSGEMASILNYFFFSVFMIENINNIPEIEDVMEFGNQSILDNIVIYEDEIVNYINKIRYRNLQALMLFTPVF